MALVLLDQLDERERQEMDRIGSPKQKTLGAPQYTSQLIQNPVINASNFCKIRSFRVQIVMAPYHLIKLEPPPRTDQNYYDFMERIVFTTWDSVSKLTSRLKTVSPHIGKLEIFIEVKDMFKEQNRVLAAAQTLLQPFRQLRNVSNPSVQSVVNRHEHFVPPSSVKVLFPNPSSEKTAADLEFENYLRTWEQEISSRDPAPELSAISAAYLKVEKLAYIISHTLEPRRILDFLKPPETISSLLYTAKVACEADDPVLFKEISARVVKIWRDYVNQQDRNPMWASGEVDEDL
jgi:hypothetical protein